MNERHKEKDRVDFNIYIKFVHITRSENSFKINGALQLNAICAIDVSIVLKYTGA